MKESEYTESSGSLADRIRRLQFIAMRRMDIRDYSKGIENFTAHLREKYPDYNIRRAYHVLIGSTMDPDADIIEEDFPGEDSVESFLQNLH